MIEDIQYFILKGKANKAEFTYEEKVLRMIKTECYGAKLYLEIEGKVMDIIP